MSGPLYKAQEEARQANAQYIGATCGSGGAGQANCGSSPDRQSARQLLQDIAYSLRSTANDLEALSEALPVRLSPAADRALYNILRSARRDLL